MEQQQKFMEMMLNAGICKPAKVDGGAARVDGGAEKTRSNRGNPGKAVPPRKCGVCGKDRVTHRDEDCWEDDRNANKRPAWHPKYKSKEQDDTGSKNNNIIEINDWLKANTFCKPSNQSLFSLNYWTPLTSRVEELEDNIDISRIKNNTKRAPHSLHIKLCIIDLFLYYTVSESLWFTISNGDRIIRNENETIAPGISSNVSSSIFWITLSLRSIIDGSI